MISGTLMYSLFLILQYSWTHHIILSHQIVVAIFANFGLLEKFEFCFTTPSLIFQDVFQVCGVVGHGLSYFICAGFY